MKKIVFILLVMTTTLFFLSNSQTNNYSYYKDRSIKTVEVVDSQLMDQILLVTEGDSVVEKMSNVFNYRTDFKKARHKKHKFEIFVSKRHLLPESYISKNDSIYEDFLTEELKDVIFTDTLTQVILTVDNQTCCVYETLYKGRQFYFNANYSLGDKPVFKIVKRRNRTTDSTKILEIKYPDIMIPFIYYNNRLYIEPDSYQWDAMYE